MGMRNWSPCCDSPERAASCVGYPGGVNRNTWFCATCKAKGFVYEVDGTPRDLWPASHDDDRWRLDNPREAKMECCEKAFWICTTASVEPRQPNTNRWSCRSCGASGWMYEVDGTPREQWPEGARA